MAKQDKPNSNDQSKSGLDEFYSDRVKELFPERMGEPYNPRWYRVMFMRENPALNRFRCEEDVVKCVEKCM